jgi:hypothetical protein
MKTYISSSFSSSFSAFSENEDDIRRESERIRPLLFTQGLRVSDLLHQPESHDVGSRGERYELPATD